MGMFNAWRAAKETREQGESRFSNPWKDTRLQDETEGADPPEGGGGDQCGGECGGGFKDTGGNHGGFGRPSGGGWGR